MKWLDADTVQKTATISSLLYEEGYALDTRRWEDWLNLYAPDCEYWVPAWKNEEEPTTDPKNEISLMYYSSRAGLEDRVWRVKSGLSAASKMLPRTQHQVSNVVLMPDEAGEHNTSVRYNWCVNQFECDNRASHTFFGRAEATLVFQDDCWRFQKKKTLILNDYIPTVVDFYSV